MLTNRNGQGKKSTSTAHKDGDEANDSNRIKRNAVMSASHVNQ